MIRGSSVALCLLVLSACRGYDYQSRISKPDGFIPGDQMARYGREQAQSVAIARAFAAARTGDSPEALTAQADSALRYARTLPDVVNAELLDSDDLLPYLRGLSCVQPRLFLAMLAEAGQHSAVDLLPAVRVPVLVVAGDRDGFTPPELSHAVADAIPDAELLMVENGSHTAPLERPDLVDEVVLDFLARCFAAEAELFQGLRPEAWRDVRPSRESVAATV